LALISTAANAWEEDVHYVLTFWLATQAGLSRGDADVVASADQSLDDSDHNSAIPTVLWIVLRGDEGAARDLQLKHFPSDALLPSPALRRVVAPNGTAARRRAEQVVASPLQATSLRELGEALHPLQDSWSHQGVPDIPFNLRPTLISAHPKSRGGWRSHDADLTRLHVEETIEAAQATYELVNRLLDRNPRLRERPGKPWSSIAPIVRVFAEAATEAQKEAWARQHVPDSDRATVLLQGRGQAVSEDVTVLTPPSEAQNDSRRVTVDASLMQSAKGFLETWLLRQDVSAAVARIDLEGVSTQLASESAERRIDPLEWCKRILTLALVADHETVNHVGHGDPSAAGYAQVPLSPPLQGAFKPRAPKRAPPLLATDFVATDVDGSAALALALSIPGSDHDTVTLIWQRVAAEWKIVRVLLLSI